MHILHVIDALDRGGAERVLVDLANATSDAGHRVSVCVTRSGSTLADELKPGVDWWSLDRRKRFDLRALRSLSWEIRERNVDLIQAHGRSSLSLVALGRLVRWVQRPLLFHDHFGVELDESIPHWMWLARHFVDGYVGVYSGHQRWARRAGFDISKIHVLPNAIDTSRFQGLKPSERSDTSASRSKRTGLFLGGLRAEKGLDILLEALARSRRALDSCEIWVAGGDRDAHYAGACRTRADSADLRACVKFLGESSDPRQLIAQADFGIVSSRSESGPLVLLEFMAAGLPVITTRLGGVVEALDSPAFSDFGVPPGDIGAMADALDRMAKLDSSSLKRLGDAGRIAASALDVTRMVSRWERLYASILSIQAT